uniref:Echinoderm microtubule-associated protein-like 2 isoform X2 n=1 Tax=Petromyzon marinus TaxID=7757 RepID=A0AAJ7T5R6_PETMA|nr:echinoderm microtubule-associated protein-like 2 isoform X2 [Petromyzon marinus]
MAWMAAFLPRYPPHSPPHALPPPPTTPPTHKDSFERRCTIQVPATLLVLLAPVVVTKAGGRLAHRSARCPQRCRRRRRRRSLSAISGGDRSRPPVGGFLGFSWNKGKGQAIVAGGEDGSCVLTESDGADAPGDGDPDLVALGNRFLSTDGMANSTDGDGAGPTGNAGGGAQRSVSLAETTASLSLGSVSDYHPLHHHHHQQQQHGGAGGADALHRLAALERRARAQDDEITVLKAALADVIRRLSAAEEQQQQQQPGTTTPTRGSRPSLSSHPSRSSLLSDGPPLTPRKPNSGYAPLSTPSPRPTENCTLRREARLNRSRSVTENSASKRKQLDKPKPEYCSEEGYVKMFVRGRPVTMYLPSHLKDDYSLSQKVALPPDKLKLEWVYGYRGQDCRCNIHLLPTGEMVYFVASVVVLYNVQEGTQRHYLGHNTDVKCIAIHPDKVTVATGQMAGVTKEGKPFAPNVRIWDSVTLNSLHVIGTGSFVRSVNCLSFSKANGGLHLMVVDDANEHVMSIWNWQKEDKFMEIKCAGDPVFAAEFHPTESNSIITCGKGHMYFWSMESGMLTKKLGLFEKHEKPKALLCLTFNESGDAVTGDSSGNILVWGKGTNKISHVISGAHESGILSLCLLRDGTLVSGGGKDRRIVAWDSAYRKRREMEVPEAYGPVRTVAEGKEEAILVGTTKNFILSCSLDGEVNPIIQGHTDELWGLECHPSRDRFFTCSYDKRVSMWDVHSHRLIWSKSVEEAAQSADFHPTGTVVAVGMQKGKWAVLDAETSDLVTLHTDGAELLSVMRYSPDGSMLAIGSHENFIFLHAVSEDGRRYTRLGKCTGHSSFITHLDWSVDGEFLVSNSGDYEILYWNRNCRQQLMADTIRDIEWATYTCVLGFHIYGVWPDGSDGTDINAVCRAHNRAVVAVADDFGKVHIFVYPCSQPKVPSRIYSGHSSHVTNVAFLHDDSYLLSTGGSDTSVMQWKVC